MIVDIIIYGATLSALWMLIACGFTLMYGVTEIVNIAYGIPFTLAAYIMYLLTAFLSISPLMSVAPSILLSSVVSTIITWRVIKPVIHSHILTMTLTFILAIAAIEVFRISFGPFPFSVPTLVSGSIDLFGIPVVLQRMLILPVAITTLLCLQFFIRRTMLGKAMHAVTQDRQASELMGVNTQQIFLLSIFISALLVALAGSLALPFEGVAPVAVLTPLVPMFAVTILGGLGSMEGAIAASLLLGYAEVTVASTLGSQFRGMVPLIIALITLQVKPEGLLGKRR